MCINALPGIKMIASMMPANSKDSLILAILTAPRKEPSGHSGVY